MTVVIRIVYQNLPAKSQYPLNAMVSLVAILIATAHNVLTTPQLPVN